MQPSPVSNDRHLMQSLFSKLGYQGGLGDQVSKFRAENGLTVKGDMEAKAGDATFEALRAKMVDIRKTFDHAPALSEGERKLLGIDYGAASLDPRMDAKATTQQGHSPESTRARLDAQLSSNQVSKRVTDFLGQRPPVPGKTTSDYVKPGEGASSWVQSRMLDVLGRDSVPKEVQGDFTKTVRYYQEKKGLLLEGQTAPDGKAGPQVLGQLQADLRGLPTDQRSSDAVTRRFLESRHGSGAARESVGAAFIANVTDVASVDATPSATNVGGGLAVPAGAAAKAGVPVLERGAEAAKQKAASLRDTMKPTSAAEAAKLKPMHFEPKIGEEFRSIAERATNTANETQRPQKFTANGAKITVNPGEAADDVAFRMGEKAQAGYSPDRSKDPELRKALNAKLAKDQIPLLKEGETLGEFKERAGKMGYGENVDKSLRELDKEGQQSFRDRVNGDLKKNGLPTMRPGESLDGLVSREAKNYGDSIDKIAEKYRLEERGNLNKALKENGLNVQLKEGQSVHEMLREAEKTGYRGPAQKVVTDLMNRGQLASIEMQGAVRPPPSTLAAAAEAATPAGRSHAIIAGAAEKMTEAQIGPRAAASSLEGASTAARAGKAVLGGAAKLAAPIGVGMSAYEIHSAVGRDAERSDGKSTELKKAIGREGGGWAGAAAGAALGSAVAPVVGTIAGGVAGYFAGSAVGESMATEREGPLGNLSDRPAA